MAIGWMDQSTQQNAAMVEETAAARNLSAEVGALSEQTALFRTRAGGNTARLPAPARNSRQPRIAAEARHRQQG